MMHTPLREPDACENMDEIRQAIDSLDLEVITLWARRFEYVKAATKFKTDELAVRAPERFEAMLIQRGQWAQDQGLNPGVITDLYRKLVTYFIQEELEHWRQPPAP